MQPGRRAFFLPGRVLRDPWAQFCRRLTRVVAGRVEDETQGGVQRARLLAARPADVHHARALCAELGVVMADAQAGVAGEDARPRLWIDAARLDQPGSFDTTLGLISLDAGCRVDALHAALRGSGWRANGLADADPTQTLGHWLATADGWLPGACAASGVHAVDVLLADGTSEQLGSFGHTATRPLGPTLRALVSGLFETAASPELTAMRAQPRWPARYRLDALLPATPEGETPIPNLAHLLLGSRGSLAWVERIHLRLQRDDEMPVKASHDATRITQPDQAMALAAVQHVDACVKCRFDPDTRFPSAFV
jgi:hypothetical protein